LQLKKSERKEEKREKGADNLKSSSKRGRSRLGGKGAANHGKNKRASTP